MRSLACLFLSAIASPCQTTPISVGELAPELGLRDLSGEPIDLAAMRPDVVVLEWTNHLCPAADWLQATRIPADTRAALPKSGVRWLMVDASWFADAHREGIAEWRERLSLAGVPYLLDAEGAAAAKLGVTVTPEVCVLDGHGRLAYRGALTEGDDESTRRNLVLEAVRALSAGGPVATPQTRGQGCGIDAKATPGADPERVDEDAAAHAAYARARSAARQARHAEAVAQLTRSLAAGLPRPQRVLADAAFAPALADADARKSLRDLLRPHAAVGHLCAVAPNEPGEPLVIAGTIRDTNGAPLAGAEFGFYHTDAAGWYSAGSTSGDNPRLAGTVRTDRHGRYRIRTVSPGYYATSGEGPAHIHVHVHADGYRPRAGHPASIFFADDPALRGEALAEIRGDGCAIRTPARNAEGVRTYVHDVVLQAR